MYIYIYIYAHLKHHESTQRKTALSHISKHAQHVTKHIETYSNGARVDKGTFVEKNN